jgi:hypothetical protein
MNQLSDDSARLDYTEAREMGHRDFAQLSAPNLLLLKAALLDGDAAIDAYRAWRPMLDLGTITYGEQRLLPLLQSNLTRLGIEDSQFDRLRGIRRYFWVRNLKVMAFAHEVFGALVRAGVPFIVLKGAALVAGYLDDRSLRPMDDIDILVPEENLTDAVAAFTELNLAPVGTSGPTENKHVRATYPGWGFASPRQKIDLHWKALHFDLRPHADDRFWQAARKATLDGVDVMVLDPADQLIHLCAHAAQSPNAPAGQHWPADAALVIRGSLDLRFGRVVEEAARHRLSGIMANALTLLSDEFGLPIPKSDIAKLRAATSWPERVETRLQGSGGIASWASRLFLDVQAFRRSDRRDFLERPFSSALPSFLKSDAGVANAGSALLVALQTATGRPAWLRPLLGRDRYRIPPRVESLPKVGVALNLVSTTNEEESFIQGWSYPESTGRWTIGREATIAWGVTDHQEDLTLSIEGHVLLDPKAPTQCIELWLNDRQMALWHFRIEQGQALQAQIAVPAELIRDREVLMLTFVIRTPRSPAELGVSLDSRWLGLHLHSLSLLPAAKVC